jgi:predicted kinase
MKGERKSTVYFLVGVPGSGKSTWAATTGLPVLSSDDVRHELVGKNFRLSAVPPAIVFHILDERAEKMLARGEDFVFDASNVTTVFRRERLTRWKKKFRPAVLAVVCIIPKSVILERNKKRTDKILEEKIESIWDEFVREPIDTSKDLFDEVSTIDEFGYKRLLFHRAGAHGLSQDIILSPVEFRQK